MLATSRVLSVLIERYFNSSVSGGRDCRLVVPGLSRRIAQELHGGLISSGIPSFLVVGEDQQPDPVGKWISAIGLTSKRIGSFVAIATPGQLVHIQDSVRGSGGAIRSLAFSEEWPWIDDGIEAFRFAGPFIDALISEWTADRSRGEWLKDFILSGLLENTRAASDRARVLLEEVLGAFANAEYPDIPDVRLRLLFHAGIPRPAAAIPDAPSVIRETGRLCRRIVERCQKEDDIRGHVRDIAAEVVPEAELETVRKALDSFLDGLGSRATIDTGLLGFHSCWKLNSDGYQEWNCLDAGRLAHVFDVREQKKAEVWYSIRCSRAVISSDQKKLATFLGQEISVNIEYRISDDRFAEGNWKVCIRNRRVTEAEASLAAPEGSISLNLNSARWQESHSRRVPLRVALTSLGEVKADVRLDLELCGPDRPAFAIVDSVFEVVDAVHSGSEETADKKTLVEEPTWIHQFSFEGREIGLFNADNEELDLVKENEGIWRSAEKFDVTSEATGQLTLSCRFGEMEAVLELEAGDIEKGEFTLEDELRVVVTGTRDRKLREIVSLFDGAGRDSYSALGGINEVSRRRIALSRAFSSRTGWRPTLTDLLHSGRYVSGSLGSFVNHIGAIDGGALSSLQLPQAAVELLKAYSDHRNVVQAEIESRLPKKEGSEEHPTYASHPIFVRETAHRLEELVVSYLQAYLGILDYLDHTRNLTWAQIFVLTHLDCVVHWDNTRLQNAFFLVGPWHPLVIAKRFMVQAALFARASRLLDEKDVKFRHLTALLGRVQGFRWMVGLSSEDIRLEPIFVCTTSDPGWHLGIAPSCAEAAAQVGIPGLLGLFAILQKVWGLAPGVEASSAQELPTIALASFMRAFPSRRSIGVRVRKGYAPAEVVRSVDSFLHSEEGPTKEGRQVPGGVRVYLEEPLGEEVEAQWVEPPLHISTYMDDQECVKSTSPDVYMLPPASDISFLSIEAGQRLPRGEGLSAVFSSSLKRLTEGHTLVPRSLTVEIDEQTSEGKGLGYAFLAVLARMNTVLKIRLCTVSSVALPQRLEAPWVIVPGQAIDPAILVKYVRDGVDRNLQERALWDYKLDLQGKGSSFYILSTIPYGFHVAMKAFFGKEELGGELVVELGRIGIAIGGEALKSGRHALGTIGLIGAVRLLTGADEKGEAPLSFGGSLVRLLVPVDSFASFFGKNSLTDGKRADLLAIRLILNGNQLEISGCGVESKYVSGTFGSARARAALGQALASVHEFRDLVLTGRREGFMPERLALLEILRHGLRISSPSNPAEIISWEALEARIYETVLRGAYEYVDLPRTAILVSTEAGLPGPAEVRTLEEGIWARLTKTGWPGINETPQVQEIRQKLRELFERNAGPNPSHDPQTPPRNEMETRKSEEEVPEESSSKATPEETAEDEQVSEEVVEQGNDEEARTVNSLAGDGLLERILLGVDEGRRAVYFDPQSQVDPLDNMNVMITGSSGKGKTQLLKYLLCKLREQGKNILVLDFKNDFASDSIFSESARMERFFVTFNGLPYNPLIPYPIRHPGTGEMFFQPGQHIAGVVSVFKRTYRLGDQQAALLKNAIAAAFEEAGVPAGGTVRHLGNIGFPDLAAVGDYLRRENIKAFNRLEPLFSLGLFRAEEQSVSFHKLTERSLIIDLSQIPSDEIKNALAQLVVMSAHAYFNTLPHSGTIRQLFTIDEAHRVLDYEFMADFVLQCRAYGVGMVLSSQYPSQFPQDVSSSMATKIIHGNERDGERIKAIIQLIRCEGREADVAALGRFAAFLDNRHYPHTLMQTMNYPLYLVLQKLEEGKAVPLDDLARVRGIDPAKLPIGNILHQLELLGLAKRSEDGLISLVDRPAEQ
jgi:hypothetical protein